MSFLCGEDFGKACKTMKHDEASPIAFCWLRQLQMKTIHELISTLIKQSVFFVRRRFNKNKI